MDIEKKVEIGKELDFEIKIENGQALIEVEHEGKLGFAKVQVGVNAAQLIDKITDLIPGEWDDALIDDLAKKLLSKKTGE